MAEPAWRGVLGGNKNAVGEGSAWPHWQGCDAPKEIPVAFIFRSNNVYEAEPAEHSGGWYADPYGLAARRWFDNVTGWSDRVQEAGKAPDKTGVARVDEAAVADDWTRDVGADGQFVPLSRPVDARYLANARPVR